MMNKIKFGDIDTLGRLVKEPIANEKKYDLLAFFISDTKYNVQETIKELEQVYDGEKTFEQIIEEGEYGGWGIGEGSGTFSCDSETAYFTSDVESLESTEIPLKELIEILYDWKAFLGE
jgi:hypothetical protein